MYYKSIKEVRRKGGIAGVFLHLYPGNIRYLGANGAGKSTLMNLITDNVKRTQGQILWDGTDILKLGASFRKLLGYMPQQQGMYSDFSARAFLRYMADVKGLKRKQANKQIEELLELVSLKAGAHKNSPAVCASGCCWPRRC